MSREYLKLDRIDGSLIFLSDVDKVFYGEIVTIEIEGKIRRGKVIQINGSNVVVQVFEGTSGISSENISVSFVGKPLMLNMSEDVIGRVFNGIGEPIDGGGVIYSDKSYDINGRPVNPVAREYPRNYISTGISSIDCLSTIIRGQKLPIFSGNGLAHNELAAQIARQAQSNTKDDNFAIVFGTIGVKHDDADFFIKSFADSGVLEKVTMFINYADDPIAERILVPRCALTTAEYLAYEKEMHVLVILTDMTSYCEALRELSASRNEVPSRKGYPGYLYSDLASIYERAGMLKGKEGSITLLPIVTMPNDDITHPIPDLTGYITEGQIVLSRNLENNGIYPPVAILPSLSRLMKDGIGAEYTREDHSDLANQLFAAYSKVQEIRSLAQIIGEKDLSKIDMIYMEFGRQFEHLFLCQDFDQNRTMEETLKLAWGLISLLPKGELERVNPKYIEKYYSKNGGYTYG